MLRETAKLCNTLSSKSRWHDFAQRDAYGYILTGFRQRDRQEFWRSGEMTVTHELLPATEEFGVTRGTALEIGCGVGRLVLPLSRHFERVVGVDVSPEMIRQARAIAAERNITNIEFYTAADLNCSASGGPARLYGRVDFIYSLLVFQHIEEFPLVEQYLQLVHAWLCETGIAYLQFDTRPEQFLYWIKNALPDRVLPRHLRRGIRRIRRKSDDLEQTFSNLGLLILKDIGKCTNYHRYVLKRC